jgi:hypothetical protein
MKKIAQIYLNEVLLFELEFMRFFVEDEMIKFFKTDSNHHQCVAMFPLTHSVIIKYESTI